MDPISLIVTALATGAAAAVKDTAGQAVKDAYSALKATLTRKLASRPMAQEIVERHEGAPDVWEKPLAAELDNAGVADDEEVVRLAQQLMANHDPAGAQAGKYNVRISGGQGITVGEHANVHQVFHNRN
jgi:hypothetical protein